jgi:hypothetical protein
MDSVAGLAVDQGEEVRAGETIAENALVVAAPRRPAEGCSADFGDPFDLRRLRLPQDFSFAPLLRPRLTAVPVRKPAAEWFIQTRPGPESQRPFFIAQPEGEVNPYLVTKSVWQSLLRHRRVRRHQLLTAVTRQGVVFLWPLRLPRPRDSWAESALEAGRLAAGRWVRVRANREQRAYDVREAEGDWPAPEWPSEPFARLLGLAFGDRVIRSLQHPVAQRLRGGRGQ